MSYEDMSDEEILANLAASSNQFSSHSKPISDDFSTVKQRYSQGFIVNKGGMKLILKATDSITNRPIAKAILIDWDDAVKTERFLKEARLTAALEHPNIIPVYDIGIDSAEGPFFTMKLVGGRSLTSILEEISSSESDTDYSLRELMEIFLKICDAIAYAHSKGIIHLDLKPDNIQIDDYGEVLVCDWGLAKVMDQPEDIDSFESNLDPDVYNDVTIDGYIKGTPNYMAPEQIKIDLSTKNQKTDIYALGGILYTLLCLKAPHESTNVEDILTETLTGKIDLPSNRNEQNRIVPPSLEAVTLKAMARNAENRYHSVPELSQEIYKWMEGFATDAEEAGFTDSRRRMTISKNHSLLSQFFQIGCWDF
jgi:serine/threonine protein kinase